MADFEINTDDLQRQLSEMGDRIDEVAPKMLTEAAPILANEVKSNIPNVLSAYQTRVKISKPKETKNGGWISNLNFTGVTKRSTGNLRNNELMAYWEYGATTTRGEGKGFMRRSIASCSSEVQSKMTEVLSKELSK